MISEIDVTDAMKRADTGSATLLDVREENEWEAGHAPNAMHIPLAALDVHAFAKEAQLVVVCRSGGRSADATQQLTDAGVDAVNVVGGMSAWEEAGQPVVRDDGSHGRII